MTGLERIAAGIPIPSDHFGAARAYCGVDAGSHRVYFALDGGRQRSPFVGPAFEHPRDAICLANLLNGDPASRPAATAIPDAADPRKDELAIPPRVDDREPSQPTGAPVPIPASEQSTGVDRVCVSCGSPLPRGSRADRLTCGAACRKAASRDAAGRPATAPTSRDADSATSDVTPTRPSTAAGPSQLPLSLATP